MTQGTTRSQFLTRAGAVGGGALAVSFGLDPALARAATAKGDIAILNYALTLEYLEAAFYTEAEQMGALSGELALFAHVVGEHERAHVAALKQVLGRKAVKRPRFNFRGTTEDADKFAATAQVLEDTGVAAYTGQAPKLKSTALLEAALAIHAVEARHAAWIRHIVAAPAYPDAPADYPAPAALNPALTKRQVEHAVAQTGFIKG